MPKCNQSKCLEEASFRFTWPGQDEKFICWHCMPMLKSIADAMGFHLQIIPLIESEKND
jgi:hypothetical protein